MAPALRNRSVVPQRGPASWLRGKTGANALVVGLCDRGLLRRLVRGCSRSLSGSRLLVGGPGRAEPAQLRPSIAQRPPVEGRNTRSGAPGSRRSPAGGPTTRCTAGSGSGSHLASTSSEDRNPAHSDDVGGVPAPAAGVGCLSRTRSGEGGTAPASPGATRRTCATGERSPTEMSEAPQLSTPFQRTARAARLATTVSSSTGSTGLATWMSKPAVIAQYAPHGEKIVVGGSQGAIQLPSPLEIQPK